MLKQHIEAQIQTILAKMGIKDQEVMVSDPANEQFGDYTTNIAMRLTKELKKNPMEIAEEIASNIASDDIIEKAEVLKPGFVNIWLTKKALLTNLTSIDKTTLVDHFHKKKVIFEFTDPNPFKEFHIGHLFTNFIGESLARIYTAAGADVRRANYQGDVGMHVAKSIWGLMKKMNDEEVTLEQLEQKTLHERVRFLGQAYAIGAQAYEVDEQAKQEMKEINSLVFQSAQEHLVEKYNWTPQVDYSQYVKDTKLDKELIKKLYAHGRTWSLDYFELIYKRLGVKFDYYYFESFIGEYGVKIVKEFLPKGIFKESEGAIVFDGEKEGLHTRVFVNSMGFPTYEAKELGLAPTKYKDFPYDLSVIVTGSEIREYFKVLIAAITATNPELGKKTKHLSHGMVRLPSGKMSSRTGQVITGEWLLDETKKHVEKLIQSSDKIDPKDVDLVSEKVAIGAIKYSFLKTSIGKDVIFDLEESLSLEGNSGPYIQYTYARCKSVLEKIPTSESNSTISTYTDEEINVLRKLLKYNDNVVTAADQFAPNFICNYLFDLAQKYNLFYQKCPILKADEDTKNFRLALTQATAQVLQNGLNLLGIETVEKM